MSKGLFDFFQLIFLKEKQKLNKYTQKMNILFKIILLVSLLNNEKSSSKINLIISGNGMVNILSDSFSLDPSEVIVNGLSKGTSCQKTCELNGDQNNVTLIFDEQIETCNYMFSGLENIKQIDLSEFDTSNVKHMSYMFKGCTNLENINFGNIDTSKVIDMNYIFGNCYNLTSIDLSNLNTPKLKIMANMFRDCWGLQEVNFGNLNTASVEDMRALFYNCKSLTSIDVSSFETSSVTKISSMFSHCESLKSLDISNFDMSNVISIYSMFSHCYKLITINLGNLTTNAKNYSYLFKNCKNLRYINVPNFSPLETNSTKEIFKGCDSLIYLNLYSFKIDTSLTIETNNAFNDNITNLKICINDPDTRTFLFGQDDIGNDCDDICFNSNSKIDIINNICIQTCSEKGFNVDYNKICYKECPEYTHISPNDNTLCEDNKCKQFYKDREQCIQIENYYLDSKDGVYKKCYQSCKYCNGPGIEEKNNCIECRSGFLFLNDSAYNDSLFETNCFAKCDFYFYFNESNIYQCTENEICPEKYNKLIMHKNKCIDECKNDNIYQYDYKNVCYKNCPNGTKILNDENYICYEIKNNNTNNIISKYNTSDEVIIEDLDFLEKLQNFLINELNLTEIDNGKDLIYKEDNIIYTITTTSNQRNNQYDNVTTIDLGKCEDELKQIYEIIFNESLYILKMDAYFEGYNFPKVEYEVYYPLNGNNLTKLNLSICENIKITISIPVSISSNDLDKYNKSSGLYNDICYTFKTESGTDECLKDRQDEYNNNANLSVCEEDCEFSEYDEINKRAQCSCFTKIKLPLISEIKIDKDKLIANFAHIKNIGNFKMLKCVHLLFSTKDFFHNSANYMLIILLISSIISIFLYIFKNRIDIQNFIKKIQLNNKFYKKNIDTIPNDKTDNISKTINKLSIRKVKINTEIKADNDGNSSKSKKKLNKKKVKYKDENLLTFSKTKTTKGKTKYESLKTIEGTKSKQKKKQNQNNVIIKNIQINSFINNTSNALMNKNIDQSTKFSSKTKLNKKDSKKHKTEKKSKVTFKDNNKTYSDSEMNLLNYEEALINDKRTYFQYYKSLLMTKHILIFTFFQFKDYNSRALKIYIFFFTFAINYTVSSMFYSDSTMHKIYKDEGSFNFTYQLPQMFYSLIITSVLKSILNNLGLYENNLIIIKNTQSPALEQIIKKESKIIKLKIISFFIITYILLFFLWIFLGCFCAVYKNTQIHLLEEVTSSFAISFITPIFVCLLPGIFRIPSLRNKQKNKKCMFNFSKFIQIF